MNRKSLCETVMEVMDMTKEEAELSIRECREDLMERLENGEMPDDILQEYYGIEPDWLDELL